jgi:transmembrane sensor
MMSPLISPLLLQKYLDNECSDQERELVEEWYLSIKGKTNYLDSLTEDERINLQYETYEHIRLQIRASEVTVPVLSLTSKRLLWLGIAASLLIISGLWFVNFKNKGADNSLGKIASSSGINDKITFANRTPRMVMHRLPDGSSVWMHSEASITYPKKFAANKRYVTFEGEGFFQVTPDKKRPFSIKTGDMNIEVLGTSFNVKAPPKQRIYEVSVVTGSVSVSTSGTNAVGQKIVLKQKQQALFETTSKSLTYSNIPTQIKKEIYEPVTIVFEGTSLDEVIKQLDKRFDVRIHLVNPLMKTCRLTADFEKQSLPAILEMLCATLDATYTMSGKTILLEGGACENL